MGLSTELARWNLDEACLIVGRRIENALSKNEDPFMDEKPTAEKYRSAKGRVKKKVKIKNGVW